MLWTTINGRILTTSATFKLWDLPWAELSDPEVAGIHGLYPGKLRVAGWLRVPEKLDKVRFRHQPAMFGTPKPTVDWQVVDPTDFEGADPAFKVGESRECIDDANLTDTS